MAGDQDDSQKTEEPTEHRLEEARKKGDVPRSQEVRHAVMLGSAALGLTIAAGWSASMITPLLMKLLATPEAIPLNDRTSQQLAAEILGQTMMALSPVLFLFMVAALVGGLAQGRPTLSWSKVAPKFDKLNPLKGFGRLFGMSGFVEFLKSLAKLTVVTVVVVAVVFPYRVRLETSLMGNMTDLLKLSVSLMVRMLLAVAVLVGVIALADYFYQRLAFLKRMRMTLQEVKDEFKQNEGDPHVKARRRQLQMERARKRMMAAVPKASVVITNPTHYAVALQYEQGALGAPKVVAKGMDAIALKIREVATQHGIPIVENPPLARSLHAAIDLDAEIQPEHYQAVAEVISYIMRQGKMPPLRAS
ncbi:MAG: flagellar biosynthesis protein FlhB [Sphingomonadales bacterium]|nr:MAG: flagellar biosynthesis protein FlhB [Sphingomonadales bacterium]